MSIAGRHNTPVHEQNLSKPNNRPHIVSKCLKEYYPKGSFRIFFRLWFSTNELCHLRTPWVRPEKASIQPLSRKKVQITCIEVFQASKRRNADGAIEGACGVVGHGKCSG